MIYTTSGIAQCTLLSSYESLDRRISSVNVFTRGNYVRQSTSLLEVTMWRFQDDSTISKRKWCQPQVGVVLKIGLEINQICVKCLIAGVELIDPPVNCTNGFEHYGWPAGCYKLFSTYNNYDEATRQCATEGATLASMCCAVP